MEEIRLQWKKFAYPLVLAWFIWVAAECVIAGLDNELFMGFLLGCGLGLLGAGICTAILDRKQTAMLDGVLKQIDELSR